MVTNSGNAAIVSARLYADATEKASRILPGNPSPQDCDGLEIGTGIIVFEET